MTQPVKQEGMPTPRTDAQICGFAPASKFEEWEVVNASFARILERELSTALNRISEMEKKVGAKQAKIDELMFEHCPDDMTPEQVAEWGRHQRPIDEFDEAPGGKR